VTIFATLRLGCGPLAPIRLRRALVLAALLVSGAVGANLAFLGLGKVFDYPAVLDDPSAEVLASFAAHRPAVIALFALLALGAGLLAPIAVLLGRRARTAGAGAGDRAHRCRGRRGPGQRLAALAVDRAVRARRGHVHTLDLVLGRAIGETLGYLGTAVFTVLVVRELAGREFGRVTALLGIVSAALVACGVLAGERVPAAQPSMATSR
jgi:hypothetical protein